MFFVRVNIDKIRRSWMSSLRRKGSLCTQRNSVTPKPDPTVVGKQEQPILKHNRNGTMQKILMPLLNGTAVKLSECSTRSYWIFILFIDSTSYQFAFNRTRSETSVCVWSNSSYQHHLCLRTMLRTGRQWSICRFPLSRLFPDTYTIQRRRRTRQTNDWLPRTYSWIRSTIDCRPSTSAPS